VSRAIPALSLLYAMGCHPEVTWPGGTGVGNPGSSSVKTRQSGGPVLLEGHGTLVSLEVLRCPPDPPESTRVDRSVDLLGDGPFPVAGGEWCTLQAHFDGPLVWSGVSELSDDPGKGTFTLSLEVGVVEIPAVGAPFVDGGAYVLELGHRGWLDTDRLGGLEDGTHIDIAPGHPAHDAFAQSIALGSAVLTDRDEDGAVSSEERQSPLAAGERWLEEEEEEDEDER
jgi:hypothetical protein